MNEALREIIRCMPHSSHDLACKLSHSPVAEDAMPGKPGVCPCYRCRLEAALTSQPEQAPILDLQLFYDQLVDGQIIKESDGEPWSLTKSEAKQIVDALSERLKIVWPLRSAPTPAEEAGTDLSDRILRYIHVSQRAEVSVMLAEFAREAAGQAAKGEGKHERIARWLDRRGLRRYAGGV